MPKEEKKIGMEINIVANLLRREMDRRYREDSREEETLSGVRWWLVHYLMQHEGEDVFQKDIEELLKIRRSTATGMLNTLEKKGLIERQPVSHDARLKKLVITPKGIEFSKKAVECIQSVECKVRSGLSEEELETFFNVLSKIRKNIEDME